MTEFGKTPLYNEKQLREFGYNIAIYPVTSLRLSNKAIEKGYARLKKEGGNASLLEDMQTRKELYKLLRYANYEHFDKNIYNFKV